MGPDSYVPRLGSDASAAAPNAIPIGRREGAAEPLLDLDERTRLRYMPVAFHDWLMYGAISDLRRLDAGLAPDRLPFILELIEQYVEANLPED